MDIIFLLLLATAYLAGSLSSAVIICRILTLPDPRVVGSHNPGATNVLRIGGRKAAIATLLGDIGKTLVPLSIAKVFELPIESQLWVGVAALIGHCYPLFYRFKGGKGVASFMTTLIMVLPCYGLFALGCWLISAWTFQRSSVGSILSAILVTYFIASFLPEYLLAFGCLAIIVVFRHGSNIRKMINGQEPLFGQPPAN